MELNTARDVNGNKKSFCNYSSSRRKTVENVSTMPNKTGDLVTWDGEKVLEDFFALVFTPQAGLQEPQVPETWGQRLAEGSRWGSEPLLQALTLSCGSHRAPGAPLDAATPVPREPPAAVRGVTRDTGGLLGQAQAGTAGAEAGGAASITTPLRLPFLSSSFSCLLKKGPDAFTLAGLPWPAARGGTRNAMCECMSVCVQY